MTRGPWGATMGGQIVGGLPGWALDRHGGDDLQPARLPVDLLRPVPIEPVSIDIPAKRQGLRITRFARAACAGDIISSLTHWGTAGLRYINADYTVAISRLPEGEYIGLAAQTHFGNDGVGTGAATLFDRTGPIGTGTALALAQRPDAFRPEPR